MPASPLPSRNLWSRKGGPNKHTGLAGEHTGCGSPVRNTYPAWGVSKGFPGEEVSSRRTSGTPGYVWICLRFCKGCPWFCMLGVPSPPFTTYQAMYVGHVAIISHIGTLAMPGLPTHMGCSLSKAYFHLLRSISCSSCKQALEYVFLPAWVTTFPFTKGGI